MDLVSDDFPKSDERRGKTSGMWVFSCRQRYWEDSILVSAFERPSHWLRRLIPRPQAYDHLHITHEK